MKNRIRYNLICEELINREMKNLGRWCEITMKKTGEVLTLVRTGYGPMEYPEKDNHELVLKSTGHVLISGSFYECAKYINDNF